jgi:hypothetical protein
MSNAEIARCFVSPISTTDHSSGSAASKLPFGEEFARVLRFDFPPPNLLTRYA